MTPTSENAKTATLVKSNLRDFRGSANLYRLDPPLSESEYVVVSASVVPYSGPETYIFPATEGGEIADGGELDGSYRGGLDHELALLNAGYVVS